MEAQCEGGPNKQACYATAEYPPLPRIETLEEFIESSRKYFEPRPYSGPFLLRRFADIDVGREGLYLVKGLIPRSGLVVIWGPPKCGKSFFVFDLTLHVALGWSYRGCRVKGGAVVYCALEGAEGFKARAAAFRIEKLSASEAEPNLHLMSAPLNLVADHGAFVAAIRAQLAGANPVAVVIDTLNRSLTGSESDDKDMAAYVRAADAIRQAFDCAIIIVHHCGHGGDRPRGHSSLIGAVDAQISVKRDAADQIIATLELAKDGPTGKEFVSRLVPVEVGTDEDGDAITSCTIEAVEMTGEEKASKPAVKLTKGARIALRALTEAIGDAGEIPPASNHIPPNVKAVTESLWRDYSYKRGISSGERRAKEKAFKAAMDSLYLAGIIGRWDPHTWIVGGQPVEANANLRTLS